MDLEKARKIYEDTGFEAYEIDDDYGTHLDDAEGKRLWDRAIEKTRARLIEEGEDPEEYDLVQESQVGLFFPSVDHPEADDGYIMLLPDGTFRLVSEEEYSEDHYG
jgi:hypothetical protein